MEVIILAILLLGLAIGGIAIKMFVKPGATFTKSCTSTYDPDSGKGGSCSCASGMPEDCTSQKSGLPPGPSAEAGGK